MTFPEYVWAITTAWCKTVPKVVPKFNMAAVKPEVVLAEWFCVVFDGFSDCYACLSRDILILCCSSC